MTDTVATLKEAANKQFREGQYGPAIQALESAWGDTSTVTEVKRQILGNRTQAYLLWGDIYTALHDADLALSPEYTKIDSARSMTAKCYYRCAKLRCEHAMYDEAMEDYAQFEGIQKDLKQPIERAAILLRDEIQRALNEPKGSAARKKAELIRACNHRSIHMIQNHFNNDRAIFPFTIKGREPELCTRFGTSNGRPDSSLSNPSATPLSIPFKILYPDLVDPTSSVPNSSFSADMLIDERGDPSGQTPNSDTIGAHIENLLLSFAMQYGPGTVSRTDMAKYSKRNAELVLVSRKGRIFLIPWTTKIKDIWEGARWPRSTPSPFKDMYTSPRIRPFERDGVNIYQGFVELYVIPKQDLSNKLELMRMGSDIVNS